MEDLVVQYHGFSPSNFVRTYIEDLLRKLHEESPSSSSLRAYVSRSEGAYKGFVRISSHAGNFFAIASSDGLVDLGHKLTERTRKQLGRWKRQRFSRGNRRARFDTRRSRALEAES